MYQNPVLFWLNTLRDSKTFFLTPNGYEEHPFFLSVRVTPRVLEYLRKTSLVFWEEIEASQFQP